MRAGNSLPSSLKPQNMQYTNSQILSAVLNKWLQPVVSQLAEGKLSQIPLLAGIEEKIRSTGWVSRSWSLAAELSPLMQRMTGSVLEPFIRSFLSNVPDNAIPSLAHSMVDSALEQGELSMFEGNLVFDKSDLEQLKRLLDCNLPLPDENRYEVKEE